MNRLHKVKWQHLYHILFESQRGKETFVLKEGNLLGLGSELTTTEEVQCYIPGQ